MWGFGLGMEGIGVIALVVKILVALVLTLPVVVLVIRLLNEKWLDRDVEGGFEESILELVSHEEEPAPSPSEGIVRSDELRGVSHRNQS